MKVAIDILILALIYSAFIISYARINQNTHEVISSGAGGTYIDFELTAFWFEELFIVESVTFLVLIYRLITICRINRNIHVVLLTIENVIFIVISNRLGLKLVLT